MSSDWFTKANRFQSSQLEKSDWEIPTLIIKRSLCHFQNENTISTLIWYITAVSFIMDRAVSYFWLQCSYPSLTHWCLADLNDILDYVFIDKYIGILWEFPLNIVYLGYWQGKTSDSCQLQLLAYTCHQVLEQQEVSSFGYMADLSAAVHTNFDGFLPVTFTTDSRFVLSQWEMALLCNKVSHWLGTTLELDLTFDWLANLTYYSYLHIIYINERQICTIVMYDLSDTEQKSLDKIIIISVKSI